MSILSGCLLNPTRYQIKNPFASIVNEMEAWLLVHQPEYLATKWPKIKQEYLKRILGIAKNGSLLRSYGQTAPNDDLGSTLIEIYDMIDHCVYFTSKYWRAFYFWLKHNKLSPCWPQFGDDEIKLACSLLTPEEMSGLMLDAQKEWLDFFTDKTAVSDLFKKIKKPVQNLCYKRISFLTKYDPAIYSYDDLLQHVYQEILVSLRNNDYIPTDSKKIVGWALKCADNSIHNLRGKALAQKRIAVLQRFMQNPEDEDDVAIYNKPRLSSFHHGGGDDKSEYHNNDNPLEFAETKGIKRVNGEKEEEALKIMNEIEDKICMKELLEYADPKIGSYLKTICYGEHNPDFWTWFYYHEPSLAQKTAYIEENPESIGPYLQRHLKLPTHQLIGFLKEHLPGLIERVSNTESSKRLIAYAG